MTKSTTLKKSPGSVTGPKMGKATLGTIAAGAMALASASPAMAEDRRDRDRGVSAGEVVAGALVIGGVAALLGAFDNDRDRNRFRDRRYVNNNNFRRGGPRRAINRCVRNAERQARRFGGWRFADVTQIRDVDRTRNGFRIRGRIEVEGNPNFRRNFDRGRFTCFVSARGRPFIDFDGVRGLR